MNTQQGLRLPGVQLFVFIFILLAVGSLAIFVAGAWLALSVPELQSPPRGDQLKMVHTFHEAMNSGDARAVSALFAPDAAIDDRGTTIRGRDEIRNWVFHSRHEADLQLTMLRSEIHAERVIWVDLARNGAGQPGYLLHWTAVIRAGRIQALTVALMPVPDGK